MKKTYIFFIIFHVFIVNIYSQNSVINGLIINESGVGIPYAVVINKRLNKGVLCDSLGRFNINANIADTLTGSCIGYFTKSYALNTLEGLFTLSLFSRVDTLKEVKVSLNQDENRQRIGIPKGVKIHKNTYFLSPESFIHAVCLNDENVQFTKIYSLNIKMGYRGNSKYIPVRINLYSESKNGFPNVKLGNKDIIINVGKYKWYRIVLEDEFIIPKSGICLGFEPLIPSNNTKKFNKNDTPILGVYNTNEHQSFSLTNYTRWYKFEKGHSTCPAVYIEVQ